MPPHEFGFSCRKLTAKSRISGLMPTVGPQHQTLLNQFADKYLNNFDTPHVYVLVCFDIRKHTRVQ